MQTYLTIWQYNNARIYSALEILEESGSLFMTLAPIRDNLDN